MPFHDFNPQKRNLIVVSLCFIIFFYGGGAFVGSESEGVVVKLSVINATFHDTEFLKYGAWVLLLWLGYQYYLSRELSVSQVFFETLLDEYNSKNKIDYVVQTISSGIGLPFQPKATGQEGFIFRRDLIEEKESRVTKRINYIGQEGNQQNVYYADRLFTLEHGDWHFCYSLVKRSDSDSVSFEIVDPEGTYLYRIKPFEKCFMTVNVIVSRAEVTSELMPFVLFFMAIIGGIIY